MPAVEVNTTATRKHVVDPKEVFDWSKSNVEALVLQCHSTKVICDSFGLFLHHLAEIISSQREIVIKIYIVYERHVRGLFGFYVEASEDVIITNTNHGRTFPCILWGPQEISKENKRSSM